MNSVHYNFKKFLVIAISISFVFGTFFFSPDLFKAEVKAVSVDDYQQMIKDLEAEKKEIEKEIANLKKDKADQNKIKSAIQKKINNTQSQINAVDRQISDLDAKIVDAQSNIEIKTQELENTKFKFRQRIRTIAMSGGSMSSSLAILLSADSLDDLLTKTELTKSISAYDNAMMSKIIKDMDEIKKSKKDIEALRIEQNASKTLLDEKKAELAAQIKEVNSTLGGINSNIGKLEDEIDDIEKAEQSIENQINAALNGNNNQVYDGEFAWPIPGYYKVGSPYGYRTHPISGKWKLHKGIDVGGSGIKGKPIIAAADGYVSLATYNSGGYGYYVVLDHGKGDDGKYYATLYAHMTKYIVKPNQYVRKGQTIGYVGTSGASTGYHLHFEIRVGTKQNTHKLNYATVDPMKYY